MRDYGVPPRAIDAVASLRSAVMVVAATAMARSRWYVTPAFTTFLVFLLLISADLGQAPGRFWERLAKPFSESLSRACSGCWFPPPAPQVGRGS